MALTVTWFSMGGELFRAPALRFLCDMDNRSHAAAIVSDIAVFAAGLSTVSVKGITGHAPMVEIRTLGYRTFLAVFKGRAVVLGCCKKQDQKREIENCAKRMKFLTRR